MDPIQPDLGLITVGESCSGVESDKGTWTQILAFQAVASLLAPSFD